jgi:uncharacterized membrane protein required for colicin V production
VTEFNQQYDLPSHEVAMSRAAPAAAVSHGVGRMLLAIGVGAVVGLALIVGDMVAAAFLGFILLMGIRGYQLGAMKIASGILGLLAALQWARALAPQLAKVTVEWKQIPEPARGWLSLIGAGLLVGVTVMLVARILARALFRSKPHWKWVDRWFGAAMGGAEGIVLSVILMFAALMLEPIARQHLQTGGRVAAGRFSRAWPNTVLALTESVRESSTGKILESLEPLRMRFNQQFQDLTGGAGADGGSEDSFQGQLKQLIEQMRGDRGARDIISSRTGLEDAQLRSLLDSPEAEKERKRGRLPLVAGGWGGWAILGQSVASHRPHSMPLPHVTRSAINPP